LSYVKLLVEAHHGSISLNSQAGKGTMIEINIPQ
jgi:two-component system phosphate regulon sensor histidine kinase PhoR